MTDRTHSKLRRLVWREHAKGPGVATFEYEDGGHDHRQMSQYEAASVASASGLVEREDGPDLHEWVSQGVG
jgi:hypothetical protein